MLQSDWLRAFQAMNKEPDFCKTSFSQNHKERCYATFLASKKLHQWFSPFSIYLAKETHKILTFVNL